MITDTMLAPTSEAELAEAIKDATSALHIQGGGTRPIGQTSAQVDLTTARLTGIELYDPGALTLVAKAGTSVAEIEAALAAENQRLLFEPMDHRGLMGTEGTPTIGGVVAANVSGPRRIQAGACRDALLGVRFVDGQGTVLKNGGRVMKNVTGYDLVKLMAGSYGTLGVMSEMAFKVLPGIETQACVLINGLSNDAAVAAMCTALGSPFEISGAAHTPSGLDGHPVTMLRLEGFADSVTYRAKQLMTLLNGVGDMQVETDPDKVKAGWAWVRDVETFHGRDGDVWRISVKPTDGPEIAGRVGGDVLFDWGGGLIWALVPSGTDLRAKLGHFRGHATLIRANAATKSAIPVFQPEPVPVAALANGLRAKFDPKGILNPGLMG